MIFNIQNGTLVECVKKKRVTNITIPNNVIHIADWAFSNCPLLSSVNISHGVTTIGDWAFAECPKLNNIWIPDSMTSIGENAFTECESLKSISIPEHLREIAEKRQFYGISSTTDILIRKPETPQNELDFKKTESEEVCEKSELEMIFEYFKLSQDKDARIFIKNHLSQFMKDLIDRQSEKYIHEITEHTDFLTIDNIDEFLRYSIQNSENGGSFKIQLILTDYKGRLLNL